VEEHRFEVRLAHGDGSDRGAGRRCPGQHGDYDIWSEGADKAPGGDGENADVLSWDAEQR